MPHGNNIPSTCHYHVIQMSVIYHSNVVQRSYPCKLHTRTISATCQDNLSHMPVICQPNIITCQNRISHMSIQCYYISVIFQSNVLHMSAACQNHISHMSVQYHQHVRDLSDKCHNNVMQMCEKSPLHVRTILIKLTIPCKIHLRNP